MLASIDSSEVSLNLRDHARLLCSGLVFCRRFVLPVRIFRIILRVVTLNYTENVCEEVILIFIYRAKLFHELKENVLQDHVLHIPLPLDQDLNQFTKRFVTLLHLILFLSNVDAALLSRNPVVNHAFFSR